MFLLSLMDEFNLSVFVIEPAWLTIMILASRDNSSKLTPPD